MRRTATAILLLLGLPLALVLACDEDSEDWPLENRVFVSQSVIEDGTPRPLVSGTQLSLRFYEVPRLVTSAGCNLLHATYEIDQGTFVLRDDQSTEMGCNMGLHGQDGWYFDFLLSRPSIAIDDDTIVLESDPTRIEYLDQEIATPDLPLSGPTWTVDTLIEGGWAMFTEWADPATLSLGEDGTVAVFTGCNTGTATYVVDGAEITFEELVVTEESCADDEAAAELETVVVRVLNGPQPVTWEVQVARLWLDGDGVGLGLVGSEG